MHSQQDVSKAGGTEHQPVQASVEAPELSQTTDANLHVDMAENQPSERQGKARGKGQKGKKTKKDYAAWAGATAGARAIATAQFQGNPDAMNGFPPTQFGHAGVIVTHAGAS